MYGSPVMCMVLLSCKRFDGKPKYSKTHFRLQWAPSLMEERKQWEGSKWTRRWYFPGNLVVKSSPSSAGSMSSNPGGGAKIPHASQLKNQNMEKEIVTRSSVLAWEIPWTEEPGRLQSTGSRKESDATWWLSMHASCTQAFKLHIPLTGGPSSQQAQETKVQGGSVFLQDWDLTGMENRSPWNQQQFQNSCSHFTANSW